MVATIEVESLIVVPLTSLEGVNERAPTVTHAGFSPSAGSIPVTAPLSWRAHLSCVREGCHSSSVVSTGQGRERA